VLAVCRTLLAVSAQSEPEALELDLKGNAAARHVKDHLKRVHSEVVLAVLGNKDGRLPRRRKHLLGTVAKLVLLPRFPLELPPVIGKRPRELLLAAVFLGVGTDVELDVVVCAVVADLDGGVEDLGRNLQALLLYI
jgi:hypothetical protein